ncbi:MAG: GTPase HflX [Bacteroidia bacterium]|nr:GTPase HflX [Bacteroidota bacterium]MCZ2130744.1 GTPase HflX [Bacteroidia bacterium]
MNTKTFSTAIRQETAILVGVSYKIPSRLGDKIQYSDNYLDELESLVITAGAKTIGRIQQRLEYPDPRTFLGKGKLEELRTLKEIHEPDMIVFDEELTPSQIRNLGDELQDVKIIDRSALILDIFARNAKTSQSKLQVELAQCKYLLPRLTRMWTHLQKQKGGVGMRGPGEKEIETDRRVIRDNITRLTAKLKEIEKQGITQRKNRINLKRFALVGYTNAGKSTVMNLLSGEKLLAEDKLFATLDATVRKVYLPNPDETQPGTTFLLSDTVGFIRKLPTLLIESFKSTLAEAMEADVLIHVADFSSPQLTEHIQIVKNTLHEIGMGNKPVILVFNKVDKFLQEYETHRDKNFDPPMDLEMLKKTWIAKENTPIVLISATEKENIEELKNLIYSFL